MSGGIDDLEAHLRRLGTKMPKAVKQALVEGADVLTDKLIPRQMAAAVPPVDMEGEYADGWGSKRTKGGAVVGNTSPLSVDIEQGRAPAPVDIKDIRREVQGRKRGGDRRLLERTAWAIKKDRETNGILPRWILRRAVDALSAEMPRLLKKHVEAIK